MSISFDPLKYRNEIARTLLLRSENMIRMCLYCFGSPNKDSIRCELCRRKCHNDCLYKADINPDNEETGLTSTKRKLQAKKKKVEVNTFTCKLCKSYEKGE